MTPPRPFTKPALSISDQIARLIERGLDVADTTAAEAALSRIGYYRLSGYMRAYQIEPLSAHRFKERITFQTILDAYEFDHRLRLITLSGLERVEVAVKAAISQTLCPKVGAHWHMDASNFRHPDEHRKLLERMRTDIGVHDVNKRQLFIDHYFKTYTFPDLPPSWMVLEALSFGATSTLFEQIRNDHRQQIARLFAVDEGLLVSWLHALSYLRNVCAHHSRTWNRKFTITPKVGRVIQPALLTGPHGPENRTYYAMSAVLLTLLRSRGEGDRWLIELKLVTKNRAAVFLPKMGFPTDYGDLEFWKRPDSYVS